MDTVDDIRSIFALQKRKHLVKRPYPYRGQRWARCAQDANYAFTVHLTQREFSRLPDYCCLNAKAAFDTLIWYIDSAGHQGKRIAVVKDLREHA